MAGPAGFRHSLLIQLIQPSIGGGLTGLVFAAVVVIIGRLPSLDENLNKLYIPQAIDNIRHDIGHIIVGLLTHSLHGYANNFFLVLFWVIVGIIMYSLLRGLASIFLDLETSLEERDYLWPAYSDPNKDLRVFIGKASFRLAVFILVLVYCLTVVPRVLHGLNNLLDRGGDGPRTSLHVLFFLAIAWLLAQGFVVLLRLLALRPRLF
jgi:hypothetical protein